MLLALSLDYSSSSYSLLWAAAFAAVVRAVTIVAERWFRNVTETLAVGERAISSLCL